MVALHLLPRSAGDVRFGVVAGKKVGGAVQRNRVRRLIREALRQRLPSVRRGAHAVWVARPAAARASYAEVEQAISSLMDRARLFLPEMAAPGALSPESPGVPAPARTEPSL